MDDKWTNKKLTNRTVRVNKDAEKILAEVRKFKDDFEGKAAIFKIIALVKEDKVMDIAASAFEDLTSILASILNGLNGMDYEAVLEQNRTKLGITDENQNEVLTDTLHEYLSDLEDDE